MNISFIARISKVFFLASLLLSGAAWADRGVTDTEILLGSHTSLSGPASTWGVASINTARLLFDEVNEAGGIHGRKIRLVVEDHQYQVPLAVRAANKLINRDGVFAMFLSIGTPHNNAVWAASWPRAFPIYFLSLVQSQWLNLFTNSNFKHCPPTINRLGLLSVISTASEVISEFVLFIRTRIMARKFEMPFSKK